MRDIRKLSSIQEQGQTDCILSLTCDLQFQSLQAMIVTHTHAKDEGQRSVGSKNRVETDGQTDKGDCITLHANVVGKYCWLLRM